MPSSVPKAVSALLAAAFVVLGGLPASAVDRTVTIKDNYYATPYVLVTVGNEVRWVNAGAGRHTVVSYPDAPKPFDSSRETDNGNCAPLLGSADCLEPGEEWPHRFHKAGTYKYYCKVDGHADPSVEPDPDVRSGREQPCGMCGIVVVKKKAKPGELVRPTETQQPRATASATPTPSATETGATPSPGETDESLASGQLPAESGRSGAQLLIAFAAMVSLGGLAYVVWQRFLAPR